MRITYPSPASAEQQSWLSETLARSSFKWADISTNVNVTFTEPVDDNEQDDFKVFATTQNTTTERDPCGRTDFSWMTLRPNLASFVHDFGIPDPRHPDSPLHSAIDTIHHELGHVVAGKLSPAQIQIIGQCFGREIESWWDDRDLPWQERVLEAFCEAFKDIYLGGHRQWDSRSDLRLRNDQFNIFLNVLDDICPCLGSDLPPTEYGEWVWVSAGFGGFAQFVGPTSPSEPILTWGNDPVAEQSHWEDLGPGVGAQDIVWFEWDFGFQSDMHLVFQYDFVDVSDTSAIVSRKVGAWGRKGRVAAVAPFDAYVRWRPVLGESNYSWGTAAGTRGFMYVYDLDEDPFAPCTPKPRPAWPYGGDPPPDPDPPPPPPPPPPTTGTRIFTGVGGVRRFGSKVV